MFFLVEKSLNDLVKLGGFGVLHCRNSAPQVDHQLRAGTDKLDHAPGPLADEEQTAHISHHLLQTSCRMDKKAPTWGD